MANTDLMKQFLPSAVGNGASYVLGRVHGRAGDMPKIKDKVPYDVALGAGGYLIAAFGKKYIGETGARVAQAAGDAGMYYFTGQLGAQQGNAAREKDADATTGMSAAGRAYKAAMPDSKAVVAGNLREKIAQMENEMAAAVAAQTAK